MDIFELKTVEDITILINTHGDDSLVPEVHGEWIDLKTAEDVDLVPLEFKYIDLGVSMDIPDGYYAIMAPRSSTFKKWGIIQANSIGIIENDYCGDNDIWKFPAVALKRTYIPRGTRIAQFCLVRQFDHPIEFVSVDKLTSDNRGGLGSTGD